MGTIWNLKTELQNRAFLPIFVPLFLINHFLLFDKSFASPSPSSSNINYTKHGQVLSELRISRIEKHLKKINKTPVLTIESPDGDTIDCVHKRNQPALDHPLLKKHRIQEVGPEMPKLNNNSNSNNGRGGRNEGAWQLWHREGKRCPEGTVPIRRSKVSDVVRAKSMFDYGKKMRGMLEVNTRVDAPDIVTGNGHQHAIAYTGRAQEIYGAKATINVWNPEVEVVNEFSLSQIWVLSGSFDGSDLNSIEAGWQVSPELYGDSNPRLFTYWTSDAYQATGCYNLLCSGFVQTNSRIAIGAAISPLSSFNGNQFDVTILIWKDPKLGNWWMSFGDNTLIGYWPVDLFTHLAGQATMVEWGGEVVNSRPHGEHTSTQMGSGHFADDGFKKASYFRNLEIVDSDNSLTSAQGLSTLAEDSNCYNIKSSYNNEWGTPFYYGGPGKSTQCP